MKLVVTGATGYIGERLVRQALSQGHEVIAASRQPLNVQVDWIPFDLCSTSEIRLSGTVDAVLHLAAMTASSAINPNIEVAAARRLIKVAEQAGAKVIFVSSQTARENAPTAYGRTKWQIEKLVLAAGGWVVRPGQVYGGSERALFGTLVSTVRKLPFIPAFLPAPKVQPVHVDDLVSALLHCAASNSVPSSVLCVGATVPVSFTNFLHTIARERLQQFRLLIPVPIFLIRLVKLIVPSRLEDKLGLERLNSLFDLPVMDTKNDLQLLGVTLRSLSPGMTRSGNSRRRNLIREGQALLAYILKVKPTSTLVRRYVRCIESIRGGSPLHLPRFMLRFPVAIALLEEPSIQSTPTGAEFAWRLNASVVLAEASIQGAHRFLAVGAPSGFISDLRHMAYAIVLEVWWRILSLAAAPVLRSRLHNPEQSQ